MKARVRLLRVMYLAPAILIVLRLLLTLLVLIVNPLGMNFRFIQVGVIVAYLVALFMYLKLYSDGDPVISVILPSIVHFVIILVFKRTVQIVPFVPLLTLDIVFLVVKGIKGAMFPFDIEDSKSEDDLSNFDETELEEER